MGGPPYFMSKCAYIKANGERCRGVAIRGSDHCAAHDPSTQAARKAGARRGGRATGANEIAQIKAEIRALIEDVLKNDGVLTGRAAVALQGYNTLARLMELARKVKETEELASELEELRTLVEGRARERRTS